MLMEGITPKGTVTIDEKVKPCEKWQPIETAPKDGTEILICLAENYIVKVVWSDLWGAWLNDTDIIGSMIPTHWQPLPASPTPLEPNESTIPMPEADTVGMHASHCCKVHGCQYGYETCPVVTGEVEQTSTCEDCEADKREHEYHSRLNEETLWDTSDSDEMIAKYEEPLRSYEAELGSPGTFSSLKGLIDSHRFVRSELNRLQSERRDAFDAAYMDGLKSGRTAALVYDHIPVERLRKMTIDEICVLVSSSDPKEEGDKP